MLPALLMFFLNEDFKIIGIAENIKPFKEVMKSGHERKK